MGNDWRERLFRPPSLADLMGILLSWRWWVLTGMLGALLGAAVYTLHPPPYRARAEVVVDYNLEEVIPRGADRELFYFLSRENKKLRRLAWSDAVLQRTAEALGRPVDPAWRNGTLLLREAQDGAWHFWATAPTVSESQQLAAAWARSFTAVAQEKIALAQRIQATQAQWRALQQEQAALTLACRAAEQAQTLLTTIPAKGNAWDAWRVAEALAWLNQSRTPLPPVEDADSLSQALAVAEDRLAECTELQSRLEEQTRLLEAQIQAWTQESGSVSPYTQLALTQIQPEHLSVQRVASQSQYVLAGSLVGLLVGLLGGLFWGGGQRYE